VTLAVEIPGFGALQLDHLLLDVNGTLTDRGTLLPDVQAHVAQLRAALAVELVSADTFGTLGSTARRLEVSAVRAASGEDKLRRLHHLGAEHCAVIGNGANDALVLEAAALGIVVVGPEGASATAVQAADVVCVSVSDALGLLLEPQALSATLRR
jgi:soluble P-type ATPase